MKKVIKYLDKPLLITTFLLFSLGLIMIFSASNVTAFMIQSSSPYKYFLKQGIILFVGLVAAIFIILFSTKTYPKLSKIFNILGIVLLALLPVMGTVRNQARSWYDLGFFLFQPSEFVKIISIVWIASYYEENKDKMDVYMPSLFPLIMIFINAILMFIQPDLGTTIIYLCITLSIFWISPVNKKIKAKTFMAMGGFVLLAIIILFSTGKNLLQERQLKRITEFRNPCSRLLTSGNQVCNTYIAINNGGLTGVGLGNSTQKYLYLPEPYTDFIFAIIVEELGLICGIGIILAFMYVLYRILKIGRESKSSMSTMICFGIAIYIAIHIIVNLMGLFGLLPMTGVPLPFMSYGGSFTLCLIVALTIVQRINIENKISQEKNIKQYRK